MSSNCFWLLAKCLRGGVWLRVEVFLCVGFIVFLGVYLFGGFCFCGVAIDGGCTVSFKISPSSHSAFVKNFKNLEGQICQQILQILVKYSLNQF